MTLELFFKENTRAALGFSGGVDSSYLLYAGQRLGADIRPYFVKTAFQPQFESDDALRFTKELGVDLTVLELDILALPNIVSNPSDRCYHCKAAIFAALRKQAALDGYNVVIDGTNASDDAGDRPGMRALKDLSVLSPLRECGLTKDEIRKRSKEAGLFTWDKPAYACLATRIPTGDAIVGQTLRRVEGAEEALKRLGFSDFRVRVFNGAARLQFRREQMESAVQKADAILQSVKPYFDIILLDIEAR